MDTAALLARIAPWVRGPLSRTEHNRTRVDKRRPWGNVLMEYVHLPKDAKTEGYPTRGAKQLLRAKAHYAEPADSCLEYVRLS